jgi:dTMP kinase
MIGEGKSAGPGIFITFEGGEGAGKTTHINFLSRALTQMGYDVLEVREPGGTSIGESLRTLVLDSDNATIADQTELFIYEAARAQLVKEVIIPALKADRVVLCDRFYDSTIAYQAAGRGLSRLFVQQANNFACQGVHPCRTILLTTGAGAEEGLERATHHGFADRLEQAGSNFHEAVNAAFLQIAEENPERVRVVSSAGPKPDTARAIFKELADIFEWGDVDETFSPEFFEVIDQFDTRPKATVIGAE